MEQRQILNFLVTCIEAHKKGDPAKCGIAGTIFYKTAATEPLFYFF
jgi:hypothetical protein